VGDEVIARDEHYYSRGSGILPLICTLHRPEAGATPRGCGILPLICTLHRLEAGATPRGCGILPLICGNQRGFNSASEPGRI